MGVAITGVTDLRREAGLGLWLSQRLCSSVGPPCLLTHPLGVQAIKGREHLTTVTAVPRALRGSRFLCAAVRRRYALVRHDGFAAHCERAHRFHPQYGALRRR